MKQMKMERILIFELNWLGDILFSFPVIKALRVAFPSARIAVAVVPRYADLFKGNQCVDRVHILSDKRGVGAFFEKVRFLREIAKEKYDTCFFLKPSGTKGFMALLSGICTRIGFSGKKMFLTHEVKTPSEDVHRVRRLLALTEAAGISAESDTYEYLVPEDNLKETDEAPRVVMEFSREVVALNPGGNWDAKRWPPENFTRLSVEILKRLKDVEIVITGAEKDKPLAEKIVSEVNSERCHAVAGKTDLGQAAALYKKCVLVVSADSGPIHLASAVGVTTIGIFGPTDPEITGPRGIGKSVIVRGRVTCKIPCYEETCEKNYICMKNVTVRRVLDEVLKALGGG